MIKATRAQWIKFVIVLVLWLVFLVWLKSWLGLVVVPFIFDAYITKKIPWTWWRKSKNPTVVTVMGWVDAIVFALVAVYFVNLYFFQNYVIPSSSLEKSLLVGDYLFVSQFYLLGILPGKIVIITAVKRQFSALKMKNPLADMI